MKKTKFNFKDIYTQNTIVLFLIMIVIFASTTIGMYMYVSDNYNVKLAKSQQQEEDLKKDLINKSASIKKIPEYAAKLVLINQLESNVNSQFPIGDEIPNMLVKINELAETNRINIISMIPSVDERQIAESGISTDQKILSKSFNVSATGNYVDFVEFIYDMAKYNRVMQINDIKLAKIDDNKINISMIINIFYVKE